MRKDSRAQRRALKRISAGGLVLALMALFGLPTVAFAANETTVSSNGVTVTVQAAVGLFKNQVSVSDLGANVAVSDSLADVVAGAGCTDPAPAGGQILCPDATVTTIVVNLDGENDVLIPGGFAYVVNANGGAGNDNLQGSNASDTLNGGAGNDILNGRLGGGDIYIGGTEKDEVTYSTRANPITVNSGDGLANDGEALENDDVGDDVEVITGGSDNDSLTGGSVDNTLNGALGDDVLHGATGDDTLVGGGGKDDLFGDGNTAAGDTVSYNPESRPVTVTAGTGNDDDGADLDAGTPGFQPEGDTVDADVENITGGSGADFLVGGTGPGTVNGASGNDSLNGGTTTADDTIIGGAGLDTVSYAGRANDVNVSLDGLPGDGEAGESDNVGADVENATGGDGDDTLTGNGSVNVLTGGLGNDGLNGAGNNDRMVGGAGNDSFNGGSGVDLADYSAEVGNLTIDIDGVADDTGAGTDNVGQSTENVTGGSGNDTITGSTVANTFNGGLGVDTLNGGDGNDTLNGGDGDDTLNGQAGSDTLNGALGADDINGGVGGGDTTTYGGRSSAVRVNVDPADPGGDGQIDTDPVAAGNQGENDNVRSNVERVTGTAFDDTISGEVGPNATNPNIWNGGGGDDTLRGGDGNDTVNGGNGADLVVGNRGRDSLVGGAGDDTVHGDVGETPAARDNLNCGTGTDTFSADALDVVQANCMP